MITQNVAMVIVIQWNNLSIPYMVDCSKRHRHTRPRPHYQFLCKLHSYLNALPRNFPLDHLWPLEVCVRSNEACVKQFVWKFAECTRENWSQLVTYSCSDEDSWPILVNYRPLDKWGLTLYSWDGFFVRLRLRRDWQLDCMTFDISR